MGQLLAIRNLPIEVAERRILPPLSLTLEGGECLVIEGRNGCGKTLLLETIAGLRVTANYSPPLSLLFCGDKTATKARLSALANLDFYARLEGATDKAVTAGALEYFSLPEGSVGSFSAGQRQRLLLARLLLVEKRLWLLDEPASNLDAEGESLLLRLITDQCEKGNGVIMTRHRGEVPKFARRLTL